MTDKEFISFLNNLEDRSQPVCKINICNFKPYDPKPEIERIDVAVADMIDLINRQQAEIERLKKLTKDRADVNFDKIVRVVDRASADIKAEAIKEFSGRLYDAFSKMQREYRKVLDSSGADAMLIVKKVLKYYEKEMVGDDK